MAIDSTGRAAAPGVSSFPDTSQIDQGTLVQLLSMQQAETLKQSLVGSLPKVADLAEMYSKVSAVGAKLSAANKVARDRELGSVDQTAASLDKVPVHERDAVEVTPADNDRFEQIDAWADDRDLDLKPMTKVIPPPAKEEIEQARQDARAASLADNADQIASDKQTARGKVFSDAAGEIEAAKAAGPEEEQKVRDRLETDATKAEQQVQDAAEQRADAAGQAVADEMAKIQPKTVVDVDAVAENKQIVADYRGSVENGTADNSALRASIQGLIKELGLDEELAALGVNGPINTLQDLENESQAMLRWAVDIVNQLTEQLNTLERDAAEVTQKLGELDTVDKFAEQAREDLDKAKETHQSLERALERLEELKRGDAAETADKLRETLADLSGSVRHAAELAQNLADTRNQTRDTVANLSEADQQTLRQNLERWEADRRRPAGG